MTFQELENLISRITYKRGFQFNVERDQSRAICYIRLTAWVTPSNRPNTEEIIPIVQMSALDEYALSKMSMDSVLQFISHSLFSLEKHELNEWFKIDGKHVEDPHPELSNKVTQALQSML